MEKIKELYLSTYFLISFKFLKEDNITRNFISLLGIISDDNSLESIIKQYCLFVENLEGRDFSTYLKNLSLKIKNDFDENELEIISNLSKVKYENIKDILLQKFKTYSSLLDKLPRFKNSSFTLSKDDFKKNEQNRAFIFYNNEIKPIEVNELLKFSDLKGYVEQKRILWQNTKALLDGSKVNNILLYGDAGCGKSTSVRALLNEFKELKMVQVFKKDLIHLDKLYEILKALPDKFIIFADDISFDETDGALSTMKAVLEGSLIQCPKNAAIYATSNRRHLVKESFQSRKGDEIHLNDTLNEISSLSERFGINLLFQKPSNEEFIDIALKLAKDNGIDIEEKVLIEKAQRLALIKGSKSPRVARQLIDNLLAGVNV